MGERPAMGVPKAVPRAIGPLPEGGFRAATAIDDDWRAAARKVLDDLGDVSDATLGVLYVGDQLSTHVGSVLTLLRQLTGIAHWVGGVGIGIAGDGRELFDCPAVTVLVGRLPADGFRIIERYDGAGANSSLDPDAAAWVETAQPIIGLVHADPRHPRVVETISSLGRETGAFLVGGLVSSRHELPQIADSLAEGCASGVLFAADQQVVTGLSQGCSPIGPTRTITACDANVIIEIDDRPALDVFQEDIGELLARDLRRVAGYIFAGLPVAGSDTADYTVRSLVGVDVPEKLIAISEEVAVGDRVLFTRRDQASAIEDLDRMLADVRRRIGDRAPRGAIYVSCLARGPNLFGDDSQEVRRVQEALGDVPLVGFFANGEICRDRLYGYTGVLTVFV